MTNPIGDEHHAQHAERANVVDHPFVGRVGQIVAEETGEVVQAIGAARGLGLANKQHGERGDQRLGKDREVGATHASAEHGPTEGRRNGARHHGDADDGDDRIAEKLPESGKSVDAVLRHEVGNRVWTEFFDLQVDGHHIGAESEEQSLAQGQHASLSPCQANADRDHRVTQIFGQQPQTVRAHDRRREDDQRDGGDGTDP